MTVELVKNGPMMGGNLSTTVCRPGLDCSRLYDGEADETVVESVIKRRMKILPGRTTLHAKESFPMRERSSRLVHFFRFLHVDSNVESSMYLSSGIQIVKLAELMLMPRYVMEVDGPSSLSSAMGILRWWNTDLILHKSLAASDALDELTRKKSSE